MTSPGESEMLNHRGSSNSARARAEALDILVAALRWRLAETRWHAIEQILTAMGVALESGDTQAIEMTTTRLESAGPLRTITIGSPPVGPTRTARALLDELVRFLGG